MLFFYYRPTFTIAEAAVDLPYNHGLMMIYFSVSQVLIDKSIKVDFDWMYRPSKTYWRGLIWGRRFRKVRNVRYFLS